MRAIIFVQGGLVQSVFSDYPKLEIELVDYDTLDCGDEKELREFKKHSEKMEAEAKAMKEVF